MDLSELIQRQQELAKQVWIPQQETEGFQGENPLIFSFDIQYQGDIAYAAADIQQYKGECIGTYVAKIEVTFPYLPQFFCFREAPILLDLLARVQAHTQLRPDLLLIDGHGLAHPRKFGVACYMGVESKLPAIGCAKETLVKYEGELDVERGSTLPNYVENELVGYVLRTQTNIKPVFVSAGYGISLEKAKEIVLHLSPTYRISEPLRRADHAARSFAKGETGNWVEL
ncbi:MAG: endonuclease V [Bacteroidia bacterium]